MSDQSDQVGHLCLRPLEGVINTIDKKWTLLVVNAIGNSGKLRFNDMMKKLREISPTTLTDTLKDLQREGLIKRGSFAEIPPEWNTPSRRMASN